MAAAGVMDHCFVLLAHGDQPCMPQCLRSLQGQTVAGRIVIATSTPSAYIEGVARRAGVAVRVNPDRGGIGSDFNFGLRCSGARLVTLAHEDDVYHPEFLERTLDLFRRRPEGSLCFTNASEIDAAGAPCLSKVSVVKRLIRRGVLGARERVEGLPARLYLSFGNPLPCSSVTFDLERLGDFRFSAQYASNIDWEAWWRLHRQGHVFLQSPRKLVARRYDEKTVTGQAKKLGRRRAEDAAMFDAIWPRRVSSAIATLYTAGY